MAEVDRRGRGRREPIMAEKTPYGNPGNPENQKDAQGKQNTRQEKKATARSTGQS